MNINRKEAERLISEYGIKEFSVVELKRTFVDKGFDVCEFKSNDAKEILEMIPPKASSGQCFLYNKKKIQAVFYNSEKDDSFSECFQLAVMLSLIECDDTRTCKRRQLINAAMIATYMSEILEVKNKNSDQKVKRTKAVCLTVLLSLVVLSVTALIITYFVLGRGFENPLENNGFPILTNKSNDVKADEEKDALFTENTDNFDFENNNITAQKAEDVLDASDFRNEEENKNAVLIVDAYSGSENKATSVGDVGSDKTSGAENVDNNQAQASSNENAQDEEEKMYLVTKSGKKYHVEGCRFVSDPSKCIWISSKSEKFSHYVPCKVCINAENDVK